jgi:hypothetical protein
MSFVKWTSKVVVRGVIVGLKRRCQPNSTEAREFQISNFTIRHLCIYYTYYSLSSFCVKIVQDHQHQVHTQRRMVGKSCRPRKCPYDQRKVQWGGWAAWRKLERQERSLHLIVRQFVQLREGAPLLLKTHVHMWPSKAPSPSPSPSPKFMAARVSCGGPGDLPMGSSVLRWGPRTCLPVGGPILGFKCVRKSSRKNPNLEPISAQKWA